MKDYLTFCISVFCLIIYSQPKSEIAGHLQITDEGSLGIGTDPSTIRGVTIKLLYPTIRLEDIGIDAGDLYQLTKWRMSANDNL